MGASPSGGRAGSCSPVAAMQPRHQRVVDVAELLADGHVPRRRSDRVFDDTTPAHDARAGRDDAQAEVRVLSIGTGEPLVEAADRAQRGAAERDVGRRPLGVLEARHVAFPVGRASCRQRYDDAALHAGHVLTRLVEVAPEISRPCARRDDVVVEKDDPRRRGRGDRRVARRRGPAPTATHNDELDHV
jgi:hypothetical protein